MPEPRTAESTSPAARDRTDRRLHRLVTEHDGVLRALIWRTLLDHDALDDVLQDTYLKALSGSARFRRLSSERTWIYRIAYNACMDHLRRRRPRLDEAADAEDAGTTSSDAVSSVARLDIAAAFAQLGTEHRVAAQLVIVDGLSYRECARITGVPEGTVASRVAAARRHLQSTLASYGAAR